MEGNTLTNPKPIDDDVYCEERDLSRGDEGMDCGIVYKFEDNE
jgi:hypothetical protein